MKLFKRSSGKRMRLFFTTDIHGSDRCFRKFLAAAKTYDAEVLLLGGDVVGKAITPIERFEDGQYRYTLFKEEHTIGEEELPKAEADINFNGFYPAVLNRAELDQLNADENARTELFRDLIVAQMHRWERLVEERLDDDTRCILTPGNDDPFVIDEVFSASSRVEFTEAQTVSVGPIWLASLGNTNRTPWKTEREYDEDELAEQIRMIVDPVADGRPLVFNFHCPPYDSGLDTVEALDEDFRPIVRNNAIVHVPAGSSAVREAIERYAPVAGLHGHIHEAHGMRVVGRTRCFNPGSDYSAGILKGLIVDFGEDGDIAGHLFTAG